MRKLVVTLVIPGRCRRVCVCVCVCLCVRVSLCVCVCVFVFDASSSSDALNSGSRDSFGLSCAFSTQVVQMARRSQQAVVVASLRGSPVSRVFLGGSGVLLRNVERQSKAALCRPGDSAPDAPRAWSGCRATEHLRTNCFARGRQGWGGGPRWWHNARLTALHHLHHAFHHSSYVLHRAMPPLHRSAQEVASLLLEHGAWQPEPHKREVLTLAQAERDVASMLAACLQHACCKVCCPVLWDCSETFVRPTECKV